jgi:hypothetical protein
MPVHNIFHKGIVRHERNRWRPAFWATNFLDFPNFVRLIKMATNRRRADAIASRIYVAADFR